MRHGFYKLLNAGEFGNLYTVQDVWIWLKTTLGNAGFYIETSGIWTYGEVFLVTAGPGAGNPEEEDLPRWMFWLDTQYSGEERIVVIASPSALRGGGLDMTHLANGNTQSAYTLISHDDFNMPAPALKLWFTADGRTGTWHWHVVSEDGESQTGWTRESALAGLVSRRYPSDQTLGLCARYGIWRDGGDWAPAWSRINDGAGNWSLATAYDTELEFYSWSPLGFPGETWKRDPDSVLPKLAVPVFPIQYWNASASILGEFPDLMLCTDGYIQDESAAEGWVVMTGSEWDQPFAVPVPAYGWIDPTAPT
jgi:hypothetical protein